MKKRTLYQLILLALILSACVEQGSGNLVSEPRGITEFNEVTLEGIGEVIIIQGNQETVHVEAEDNVLNRVKTELRDNTLVIHFLDASSQPPGVEPTLPIKYYLTMKEITRLYNSGVGSITASNIEADQIAVDVSGTGNIDITGLSAEHVTIILSANGNITIDSLKADKLDVKITGTGDCNLSGEVTGQNIEITSSGSYHAAALESQTADVSIAKMGSAQVWVAENITAKIAADGVLEYYGNPVIIQADDSTGEIISLGNP